MLEMKAFESKSVDGFTKLREKIFREVNDKIIPIIKERHTTYFKSYF